MDAKNSMLSFMEESGVWPEEHTKSLANFFFELELHPRKWKANGKKTLIIYQSRVRRAWFDALKQNKGCNIELIEEELLHSITKEVNNSIQELNMEQVEVSQVFSSQPLLIIILPSFFSSSPSTTLPYCHVTPAATLAIRHWSPAAAVCRLLPAAYHSPTRHCVLVAVPLQTIPHIANTATSWH